MNPARMHSRFPMDGPSRPTRHMWYTMNMVSMFAKIAPTAASIIVTIHDFSSVWCKCGRDDAIMQAGKGKMI